MLGITHFAAGALIGSVWEHRVGSAAAAVVSHGLLDCIPHDDETVGVGGQAVLALLGAGAVVLACGATATPTTAGVAGAAPDGEVVFFVLRGRSGHMAFPSHWQRPGRRGDHPWQLRGPRVPLAAELIASITLLGLACRRHRRRRRR